MEKAIAEESLLERTEAFSIDPRLSDARTVTVSVITPRSEATSPLLKT